MRVATYHKINGPCPIGRPTDRQGSCKSVGLWGNSAFLCAYLLGEQFTQSGWGFTPGGGYDVGDLPTHTYKADGESCMTPCAEAWLTDRAADRILAAGYMPVLSIQGRDAVRVVRFQSLADPVKNLAGRWG